MKILMVWEHVKVIYLLLFPEACPLTSGWQKCLNNFSTGFHFIAK